MMWRHRFITDSWAWELPMGLVEDGESPEQAAAREVLEETGWRPGPIKPLIYAEPANGITDSQHHVFRVDGATYAGPPTEKNESDQAVVALLGSPRLDAFFRITGAQLRLAFAVMGDDAAFQAPWVTRDRKICDLIRGGRRQEAKGALRLYLDESERLVLDAVRAASRSKGSTR